MQTLHGLLIATLLFGCAARGQQAYHQLEIIPDTAAVSGELRFVETTGWTAGTGGNYVGFKSPASIGSNLVWTLPAVDSTGVQCMSSNGSGVLSWSDCSGGSSLPVVDTTSIVEGSADATKEIRFEVDGLTTGTVRVLTPQNADYVLAGTNLVQTFSSIQTFSAAVNFDAVVDFDATATFDNIAFESDSVFSIGASLTRALGVWADDVHTEDLFFRRQSQAGHDFLILTTGNQFFLKDSSSTTILLYSSAGADQFAFTGDLVPGGAGGFDLGLSGGGVNTWNEAHIKEITVYTDIDPDTAGGADIGTVSLPFNVGYANHWTAIIDFLPDVNEGTNLGTSAGFFDKLWIDEIIVDLSIIPDADDTVDFGSLSNQFRSAWFDGTVRTDSLTVDLTSTFTGMPTFNGEVYLASKIRTNQQLTSGSPASPATHKIPIYDSAGTLINYVFLYP